MMSQFFHNYYLLINFCDVATTYIHIILILKMMDVVTGWWMYNYILITFIKIFLQYCLFLCIYFAVVIIIYNNIFFILILYLLT